MSSPCVGKGRSKYNILYFVRLRRTELVGKLIFISTLQLINKSTFLIIIFNLENPGSILFSNSSPDWKARLSAPAIQQLSAQ